MLAKGGYKLKRRSQQELGMTLVYEKSMPPEVVLDELYKVVPINFIERYAEENEVSGKSYLKDFEPDEIMYPSMMTPQRKEQYERQKQGWEFEQAERELIKRELHGRFIHENPDDELVVRLMESEYGREVLAEFEDKRSLSQKPESGTGADLHDEQERDGISPHPVAGKRVTRFLINDAQDPFSELYVERDQNGRIIEKELGLSPKGFDVRYEYDGAGRLCTAYRGENLVELYKYGKYGERLYAESYDSSPRNFRYGKGLQLTNAGDTLYRYDEQGRLIMKQDKGQVTRYSWLDSGALREVFLPDGRRVSYSCDPAGTRISKSINGVEVEKYLWKDLTTLSVVTDGEGNNAKTFSYDEEGDPLHMVWQGRTYYLAVDQIGTVYLVADDNGNEIKRVIYDSFGNMIVDTDENFHIPLGFAAGLFDKDTGIIHFGYREYDPDIGRFISPDPLEYDGGDVDVYGYCLDDPVNFVDRVDSSGQVQVF